MGNTPLRCVSGGGRGPEPGDVEKVRMLLPDGNIILLEGPVEAADLMIEHINHMVMHCSAMGSGAKGERTIMTILQPHEKLQPGQAYVLHPIPSPSTKKTKKRSQQFSVPNLNSIDSVAAQPFRQTNDEAVGDKDQEQAKPFRDLAKTRFLQKYRSRVADSSQSENAGQAIPALKSGLTSTAGGTIRHLLEDESREQQKDTKDHAMDEDTDDNDVLLNLNMYMGWRPALESIPESPLGNHHHNLDMVPQLPLLCI